MVATRATVSTVTDSGYLMAGQRSELERLQLQARVWEPAGAALLRGLGDGAGLRVLDVGCGALGWLRVLADWVGPDGEVIGIDIDPGLLDAARTTLDDNGIHTVTTVLDDLFASELEPATFDVVHARFQLAPLGRVTEQLAAYRELVAPGGLLVLEDSDSGSWHFGPPAAAAQRLIALVLAAFRDAGGNFDAGRGLPGLLRGMGLDPDVRAEVRALPPGHPYLRAPIQFSVSLESRLASIIDLDELARLRTEADRELADPGRWGTTFTLVQSWARVP